MRSYSLFSFLLISTLATLWIIFSAGCANIIPPAGGPRDTTAPKLVSASPKDSTLNFRGERIVLNFDEYLGDLQDLQNNLLFTPTFEVNPEIAVRAKTLTIRFRDSLQPNTTYIFNFGNAIRDINENNALRNFVYTFSTGAFLDTLTLSGKVLLAETGKTDSTLVVLLHRNLTDSAVIKERPTYVSRVDANGNFFFKNLPAGPFAIYALGDAGLARRYQSKAQLFAFSNETAQPGQEKAIALYAYKEVTPAATNTNPAAPKAVINAGERRLRFTTTPATGNLDLKTDFILNFQTPLRNFDSTQLALSVDSNFVKTSFSATLDSTNTALRISTAWREGTTYNLILNRDFAEDSAGRKLLKNDTLQITTKKSSDYGQLRVRIKNLDAAQNPVLLFVQNGQVISSAPLTNGSFAASLFTPGDYELRILYDSNKNGRWDAGNFFNGKKQPELVVPVSRRLVIKAGLDNEFEISL